MTAALYVVSAYAAVTVTVNGSSHTIPQTNERGWGTNVTAWIQAISQNTLQPSGGTFTLTADTNFGANFGLVSPYFKSRNSLLSSAGVLRLGNTDTIGFRNNANSANLLLGVDTSDRLTFNAVPFLPSAALTASRALASDASGVVSASSVTLTELGYVSGVTSAIQTQVDTKASTTDLSTHEADTTSIHGITDTSVLVTLAGAGTLTNKTIDADGTGNAISNIENADIKALAAIALSKLAVTTVSRALVSDGSGVIAPATTTSTEIGYVNGVTSAIQTQIDARQARATLTTKGDLYVATASATVARQAIGTDTHVLTADSSLANGLKWSAPAAAPAVPTIQVLTGTSTYTRPANVRAIRVRLVGAGGGGGGTATASGASGAAGGGGAGGCVEKLVTAFSGSYGEPISYAITTGAAGGAAGNNNGAAGSSSTFGGLTAGGGAGGLGSGAAASPVFKSGGVGGTAAGGDLNIPGGAGNPGAIGSSTEAVGGNGGSNCLGGGVGNTVGISTVGATGVNYGGGGAGAVQLNDGGNLAGGTGAGGRLIIEEFY